MRQGPDKHKVQIYRKGLPNMNPEKSRKSILKISFAVVFLLATMLLLSVSTNLFFSNKDSSRDSLDKDKGTLVYYLEDEEGNFILQNRKEFPKEGYVLDVEKSSCLKGGVLSQDPETKTINLKTSNADSCTLYFSVDNREKPNIIDVDIENGSSFAALNSVIFEKEFLIESYFISVDDGEYRKINVKDSLPFDFCGHGGNYARSANFSIYAVTTEGIQSEAYVFSHGGFECANNISNSESFSQFESFSVSASYSTVVSQENGNEIGGGGGADTAN